MSTPILLVTSEDHQAKALATAEVTAPDVDVMIINGPGEGLPIEQVRELKSNLAYRPLKAKVRTIILCHLEQASIPAQNALLKTLEEPPEYVNLIAVTTNLGRILPTIQSRCRVVQLASGAMELGEAEAIAKKLTTLSLSEKIELAEEYKDREAALTLIDQLIHYYHQSTSAERMAKLQQLLKAKDYLQHNTNPQLTVETLFFFL